jgi:FtsP/CotA-like multicopper oxidase with cupredoxin domain
MNEFQQQVLPASMYSGLSAPFNAGTFVWGYQTNAGRISFPSHYPAFTIVAKRGIPTNVKYVNNLVDPVLQSYLTVDQTLHWANPLGLLDNDPARFNPFTGPVPAVVHLHGAEVPSAFDGNPDTWFTPGSPGTRIVGPAFVTDTYSYPNGQEATTLWFHDHALGATRLDVFAGLAGFYLLRDDRDTGLPNNPIGLPAGPFEVEIVIQDRQFDTNGQLLFPDGDPSGLNGPPPNPDVHPFWSPEFFGDTIVVNGKSWPFLNVEPRRYRFRLLNGSNARFYELRLDPSGPPMWQIGTDGGLLDSPVMLSSLLMAPAERADVIVDLAAFAGRTLTLTNSAKAPFPSGAKADPQTVGQVMQFRVNLPLSNKDTTFDPAKGTSPRSTPIVRLGPPDKRRQLVLVEIEGPGGPLEVLLNNTKWDGSMSPNGGGVTEMPQVGSTEVWEIINTTADAHPIHIHLIQFQPLSRQSFNASNYRKFYDSLFPGGAFITAFGPPLPYGTPNADGAIGGNPAVTPFLQGPAMPPNPNENGWKDTMVMRPGQVTRVIARWAPQDTAVSAVSPGTNLFSFDPSAGPGYVWHCHILDHEDNEMMRPYTVSL